MSTQQFASGERVTSDERASSGLMQRRDFFRVLGGGLFVAIAVDALAYADDDQPETGGGRGGRGREEARELAAWLHIDEKGRVTAYTGKVEIGQNIRTSLAQTIADELRVPLASITMVMADTDLTPYDAGTFGSQTTPRMAPQLARAAATAREMLINLAAERWKVPSIPSVSWSLTAEDGRVVHSDGRVLTYGELTKGQKLTGVVSDQAIVSKPTDWKVRGTAAKKVNGRAIVTGAHQFTPDVVRPNMLYGRLVRPDRLGATTLVSVDESAARALAGVTIVRDGDFLGVVATSERLAARAASLVRAEWRASGSASSAGASPAATQSSQTIFDYLRTAPDARPAQSPFVAGDVAGGWAGAAHTLEATYEIPYIAHVPLEPRTAIAEWDDAGKLTAWVGTQRPFGVRGELAQAFQLPEERVRVICPDMGSAYGGKHSGEHAVEAARLARLAKRPVKLVWTRAEEFMWGYFRPAGVIGVKSATDASGRLVAWSFDNYNSGNSGIRTPYDAANQRIAFHPSTSPLKQGSYRGLAATANHYAREMHMDEIARAMGIDAVEFRLRNLKDERMRAVLKAAAERAGWPKGWPRADRNGRAWGIACGTEKGSVVATAAEVSKTADGFRVERLIVSFECGAIVNPDGLNNQVEGGVVQGLGGALFEAIEFAEGRIINGSLARYRVPRFSDMPAIDVILLNRPDLPSVGAGETPIVAVAPAIGSAVRALGDVAHALPVRLKA
jgi:nicotinate dehydrogenase subunit B